MEKLKNKKEQNVFMKNIKYIIILIAGILTSFLSIIFARQNLKIDLFNKSGSVVRTFIYIYIVIFPIYKLIFKEKKLKKDILNSLFFHITIYLVLLAVSKRIFLSQILLSIIISFMIPLIYKIFTGTENKKIYAIVIYYSIIFILIMISKTIEIEYIFAEYSMGVIPVIKTLMFLALIILLANSLLYVEKINLKKEKKIIINILSIIIFLSITSIYIFSINGNISEKYIDTSKNKKYKLTKESREKLKKVDKKIYIFMKDKAELKDVDIILKNIQNSNEKIVYLDNINNRKNISNKDLKNEMNKFKDFTQNIKDDDQTIYIIIDDGKNKKKVKAVRDLSKEIRYISENKIKLDLERKVVNGILTGANKDEILKNGKIGIISNAEPMPKKDYAQYIRDLEYLGYKFEMVDLKEKVKKDFKLLILMGTNIDLTDIEKNNLNKYLDEGNNILIASKNFAKNKEKKNLLSITKRYGAYFEDAQILDGNLDNRYIYQDEEEQNQKQDELQEMYKKGTTVNEIDKKQKELIENEFYANNDIIFGNVNLNSKIAKNVTEDNDKVFTIVPNKIILNEKYIKENKIKKDIYYKTSNEAVTFEKYNLEASKSLDLNKYLLYGVDKKEHILGVNLERKNGSNMTMISNLGMFLSNFQTGEMNAEPYNEMQNSETLIEIVNILLNNKNLVEKTKIIDIK